MRDERDEGYFADGASVGKVKQECSSLVDDTTAMVKSEVLFHSVISTDGASRMSSIKGQTLPSLIRLRFYRERYSVPEERNVNVYQSRRKDGSKRPRERTVDSTA